MFYIIYSFFNFVINKSTEINNKAYYTAYKENYYKNEICFININIDKFVMNMLEKK